MKSLSARSFVLSVALLLSSCGFFSNVQNNRSDYQISQVQIDQQVDYLSFDETLDKLQTIPAETASLETKTWNRWLWQNLYANIADLTPEQRDQLDRFLERPTLFDTKVHGLVKDAGTTYQTVIPDDENFSIDLLPHHSIRIPVTSFCLNANKSSPSNALRYSLMDPDAESLSRQILFKYLESREDDSSYQHVMWSLENKKKTLASLPTFLAVLDEMGFTYDADWTLEQFESDQATRDRFQAISLKGSKEKKPLNFNLISTGSYSSGQLIIMNESADETVTVEPADLQINMQPATVFRRRAQSATGDGTNLRRPDWRDLRGYQNIHVSGANPHIALGRQALVRRAARLNNLNRRLDAISETQSLNNDQQTFVDAATRLTSELAGQGEFEPSDRLAEQLDNFADDLETGADWATALTPGVNDLRDLYELTNGKDLISGEELSTIDRAVAGAGLVLGSGAVYRKTIDALARGAELTDELYTIVRRAFDSLDEVDPIDIPWDTGKAYQEFDMEAIISRVQVLDGQKLYRLGTRGRNFTGEAAQFWSLEFPGSASFSKRHGIPPENAANPDFIEIGTLKEGNKFIIRRSTRVGENSGGAIEVVVPPGGVDISSHLSL